MRYTVVTGTNAEDLSKIVEKMLGWGWKLQGGVAAVSQGMHATWGQAMILEVK